jgi:DUF971 family protein
VSFVQSEFENCAPPLQIERRNERHSLLLVWSDNLSHELPLRELRAECMCARCVDELTGQRIVELDGIDPDIVIRELKLVGNYALKITWSDGHDTGLYTWPHLRRLCVP